MRTTKKIIISFSYGNRTVSVIRILLGALFVFSGFFKALDPYLFGKVIDMYGILPNVMIPYAAILFSCMELLLGACLLCGYKIRAVSFVSLWIMGVFIIAITINVVQGNSFDCGCFELKRFGVSENVSWILIVRDTVLIFLFLIVFQARKHFYSIDSLIEKGGLRDI